MKYELCDADLIKSMNGELRRIPGLINIIVEQATPLFSQFGKTTTDNIQLWLDCEGERNPLTRAVPIRHTPGCIGFVTLVVQRIDVTDGNPRRIVRFRPILVRPQDLKSIKVNRTHLSQIKLIHDDFVDAIRPRN